ncbi:sigma 54-interacting transcriptional regulator [Pseudomonas abyssi]|uniref:Fis family transcriptional regulator n=1 Tax=Pseudomonas abyssi TaxID=170540 RepID=A0A395R0K6_9PSED|nr:sigma 54-interacting transcriptional regulator [Halopseudomonas gallaeciensis]RGP53634.1 Fis family transcriptional regulator [Halopseudomonas gallaeciensis]
MNFANEEQSRVRICMLGNSKFSQMVHSLIPEFESAAEITIIDNVFFDAVKAARERVERNQVDIFISAGANAFYLQDTLPMPVVALKVEQADQISAILKARRYGSRILLLTYTRQETNIEFVRALDDLEVVHRTYSNAEEAREVFHSMRSEGCDVVVGSSYVCDLAEQMGFPYVLLYSKESCRNLIRKAVRLAGRHKRSVQQSALTQFLVEHSPYAQILTNRRGDVVSFNSMAKHLLPDLAANRSIEQYLDARFVQQSQLMVEGVNLGDRLVRISKDPFDLNKERIGYLFNLHPSPVRSSSSSPDGRRLVFSSAPMAELHQLLRMYGATPGTVLLRGETGTGKELAAREIHAASQHPDGPFIAVNCAAIPSELFEAELFGYADGAFTHSRSGGKSGLLEAANHGTFFLDEINAMPMPQQAKLLRVLQEREIRPVGSKRSIALDIKFVAACNLDLHAEVSAGRFREDLYYRLNIFTIKLPCLRERLDDLPLLVDYFAERLCEQYQLSINQQDFREALLPSFRLFEWPGNVRQLENLLERLVVSYSLFGNISHFKEALPRLVPEIFDRLHSADATIEEPHGHLQQLEHEEIVRALERFSGNKTQTAEYLGISQTTLWRRLKQISQ